MSLWTDGLLGFGGRAQHRAWPVGQVGSCVGKGQLSHGLSILEITGYIAQLTLAWWLSGGQAFLCLRPTDPD